MASLTKLTYSKGSWYLPGSIILKGEKMEEIFILFTLSLFLVISSSINVDAQNSQEQITDVYIFVQTFVRNSDGQLVHYFENDKFTDKNLSALDVFLDSEASRGNAPEYDLEGKKFQLIQRSKVLEIDSFQLVASTKLEDPENPISPFLVRYAHDGFFLTPGDELTQVWTFFREI